MAETVAAAGDMDVRLRQIIIQGDALLAGQRMALAHDAHVAILEQAYMACLQYGDQRCYDDEVQAAGCQCLGGFEEIGEESVLIDIWIYAPYAYGQSRQYLRLGEVGHADAVGLVRFAGVDAAAVLHR